MSITHYDPHLDRDIPCPTPTHLVVNDDNSFDRWTFCPACRYEDEEPLDDNYMMLRDEYGEKHYYTITRIVTDHPELFTTSEETTNMRKNPCKGKTNAGKPCGGGAMENGYCGPHQDQAPATTTVSEEEMTMEEYDEQFWAEIEEQFDYIVSGTGARSLQVKVDDAKRVFATLRERLRELKEAFGKVIVLAGGAEGFDSALASAAKAEGIPYILALPSKDYGNYYWKNHSVTGRNRIEKFNEYVEHAYRVIYVCEDYRGFEPKRPGKANFDRNQYMVDHAMFFYVYDPTSSGTRDCVRRINNADKKYEEVK